VQLDFDQSYMAKGERVVGIDEAGRGPLAGPVVAGCVFLGETLLGEIVAHFPELNDSKKLSATRRENIFRFLVQNQVPYGTGYADPEEIDCRNILNATSLAMQRAVDALGVPFHLALVDGAHLRLLFPNVQIVGGDGLSPRIALASIVAKVVRDRMMVQYEGLFPRFRFSHHKGYGTARHLWELEQFGPSPLHRLTFRPVWEKLQEEKLCRWVRQGRVSEERKQAVWQKKGEQTA